MAGGNEQVEGGERPRRERQLRDQGGPVEVVIEVVGPLRPADATGWCARTVAALRGAPAGAVAVCDVRALGLPDLAAVEVLARIQLTARRSGHPVRLRGACPRLRSMLRRLGLDDVLPDESIG